MKRNTILVGPNNNRQDTKPTVNITIRSSPTDYKTVDGILGEFVKRRIILRHGYINDDTFAILFDHHDEDYAYKMAHEVKDIIASEIRSRGIDLYPFA